MQRLRVLLDDGERDIVDFENDLSTCILQAEIIRNEVTSSSLSLVRLLRSLCCLTSHSLIRDQDGFLCSQIGTV